MPFPTNTTTPPSTLVDAALPRGLRDRTAGMSWEAVLAAHGPTVGPLRLGGWKSSESRHQGRRPWLGHRKFQATLAIGDRICTASVAAGGPVAALTEMLYEHGFPVEMLEFHQRDTGTHTVTFVHGSNGLHDEWAVGWDSDATQSALRAVVACANRVCA